MNTTFNTSPQWNINSQKCEVSAGFYLSWSKNVSEIEKATDTFLLVFFIISISNGKKKNSFHKILHKTLKCFNNSSPIPIRIILSMQPFYFYSFIHVVQFSSAKIDRD